MIPIPKSVYIALAMVLALYALYRWGHHVGWAARDVEMQAAIAQKNEESRQKEQTMALQLNSNATKLQEVNHALSEKSSALDRAIRAGRVRFPAPSCVQAAASAAPAAGDRDQAGGQPDRQADQATDAERATLAAIAEIVAQADRNTAQLNACIDAYNQMREQINGQR